LGLLPGTLAHNARRRMASFISHYERLTRHMIDGGVAADATARLGEDRTVQDLQKWSRPAREH
jgi:D-glycerate 3-kinase